MVKCGDTVQENLTGRKGIVTARIEYLYSSPQVMITSKGESQPDMWTNEKSVSLIEEGTVKP